MTETLPHSTPSSDGVTTVETHLAALHDLSHLATSQRSTDSVRRRGALWARKGPRGARGGAPADRDYVMAETRRVLESLLKMSGGRGEGRGGGGE